MIILLCLQASPDQRYMCQKTLEAAGIQYGVRDTISTVETSCQARATRWARRNVDPTVGFLLVTGYAVGVRRELQMALPPPPGVDRVDASTNFRGAGVRFSWGL